MSNNPDIDSLIKDFENTTLADDSHFGEFKEAFGKKVFNKILSLDPQRYGKTGTEMVTENMSDVLVKCLGTSLKGKPPGFEKKITSLVNTIVEKAPLLIQGQPIAKEGSDEIRKMFEDIKNLDG